MDRRVCIGTFVLGIACRPPPDPPTAPTPASSSDQLEPVDEAEASQPDPDAEASDLFVAEPGASLPSVTDLPPGTERPASSPWADLPPPPPTAAARPRDATSGRPPGKPWATQVMEALNAMDLPAFPAEADPVRFRFVYCKDGSVERVDVDPTDPVLEDAITTELLSTTLPIAPDQIQARMRSECAKINYTFSWTAEGIR